VPAAPDQPPSEPNETAPTRDWKVRLNEKVWALRSQHNNLYETVTNQGNNYTTLNQTVQQISQNINNTTTSKPPVIYGTHSLRLSGTYTPGPWAGYLFVETDRFQAVYYSNNNTWVLLGATGYGPFENRFSGFNSMDAGWEWIETSRNNITGIPPYPLYRWNGSNWNFIEGEFYRNQNQLAVLAGTFAANNSNNGNDVGARVNVADFRGQLQWTNANNANGWAWGPDDCRMHGMGPILAEVDPSPATGWHLYDGTNNVNYLQANGSVGAVNLPNLAAGYGNNNLPIFLATGSADSGINAPIQPVITANLSFNSANFTGNNNGASVLTGPNPFTFNGNANNNNGAFAVSNNGTPPNLVRRPWFRQ